MKNFALVKLLPLLLVLLFCVGGQTQTPSAIHTGTESDTPQADSSVSGLSTSERQVCLLNDVSLEQYCLVYCDQDVDYTC